uniref:Retroviral polymerase SH3-like domain-containing protein n=1 Tax=Nicotiana tabacum TaxID=4097 RepID=A0A1S3XJ97_TOBAC|nr:PREDICTED: uncharacterized protein LOC107765806 [Nicotiana tabacum]
MVTVKNRYINNTVTVLNRSNRERVVIDVSIVTAMQTVARPVPVGLWYKSSFEMLHSHPPNFDYLKNFGCLAYASNPNITNKMSPRAIPAALMGYSSTQKGYKLYDLHAKSFFVSRNVVFREDLFPFRHFTPSTLPLFPLLESTSDPPRNILNTTHNNTITSQTIQEDLATENPTTLNPSTNTDHSLHPVTPNITVTNTSSISSIPITEPQQSETLRKFSRIVKQPLWMQDFVTTKKSNCAYPLSSYICYEHLTPPYKTALNSYSSIVEPASYKEAGADPK